MNKNIQEKFDLISQNYDSQRKKLIPCFDDFYNISVSIAESEKENPKVLDIGAGTGLLSAFILKKYPEASLTLIDISNKMLEIAKQRFKNFSNINYISDDYTKFVFNGKYDIIISALSIHHLSNYEKSNLIKKCYTLLEPNGIFINADQVLGETPFIETFNKKMWRKSIETSGLSREELDSCYNRIKLDKEATLEQQLNWLKEAGFSDVSCAYKHFHFAAMVGRNIP